MPDVPCAQATMGKDDEPLKDLGTKGHKMAAVAGTGSPKLSSETYMNLVKEVPGGIVYVVTLVLVSSFRIWPGFALEKLSGVE